MSICMHAGDDGDDTQIRCKHMYTHVGVLNFIRSGFLESKDFVPQEALGVDYMRENKIKNMN